MAPSTNDLTPAPWPVLALHCPPELLVGFAAVAPNADGFCWLVEEFGPDGGSTGRYMLDQGALTITADVHAAKKLRRQQSAGFRALDMKALHKGDWRAVEHGFSATAQPAAVVVG